MTMNLDLFISNRDSKPLLSQHWLCECSRPAEGGNKPFGIPDVGDYAQLVISTSMVTTI